MLLFFSSYFWLVGGHGSRCYIFIKQIFFCSYVLQARSLGSWSKVSPWPCWPLSVPIENPQALKTFGLCCCYCLRPYLNTVHTPTCPECNTNRSYRATWNYSVSDSFILGFNTAGCLSCLSFWPQRWLAGDSLWPDQDWSVARPQGASAMVVTHAALAWNQCFLCFKYVEFVHWLSDSTCWASSRDPNMFEMFTNMFYPESCIPL